MGKFVSTIKNWKSCFLHGLSSLATNCHNTTRIFMALSHVLARSKTEIVPNFDTHHYKRRKGKFTHLPPPIFTYLSLTTQHLTSVRALMVADLRRWKIIEPSPKLLPGCFCFWKKKEKKSGKGENYSMWKTVLLLPLPFGTSTVVLS